MADNRQDLRAWLQELSHARGEVYAFLGSAFLSPPTKQSLDALGDDEFLAVASELFGADVLEALRKYAQAAGRTDELERQTHLEFMNLFKVPGGQYITPYESVFRDARDVGGKQIKGLLMGQSAVNVQKWYKLAAVEISDEYKDLPDHIGLELNFLAHLCAKEDEFRTAGDQAKLTRAWEIERDFLTAHVASWSSKFRDKLYDKSQNAYFRAVADVLVVFCQRDLAALEKVVGPSAKKAVPEYEANT